MTTFNRAWWIRIVIFGLAAQPLGYLLAVILHDRYSVNVCAFVIVGVFMLLEEIRLFVEKLSKRRSAFIPPQSSGNE